MNVRLLRRVKKAILQEPTGFNMREGALQNGYLECSSEHPCFTTACIAGWTVFLEEGNLNDYMHSVDSKTSISIWWELSEAASEYLELPLHESDTLFHAKWWPYEFRDRLGKSPESDAKVTA